MYINLYPQQQLRKTKNNLLAAGIFLAGGGLVALVREFILRPQVQTEWVISAVLVLFSGILCLALALGKIQLKDAYFSMTPDKISYRLSLLGPEQQLYWKQIREVHISEQVIAFELYEGCKVYLRLGAVSAPEKARHIASSIRLAALEQQVTVNGVKLQAAVK